MSIFCLGTPPGRVIPVSEYNLSMDEDRFFLPGVIHGGNYLIHIFAYGGGDCDKIDASYVTAADILKAQKAATALDGTFFDDIFIDMLDELSEHFICDNLPDDPCFATLNAQWGNSRTMTSEELIEWANAHS